MSPARHSAQGDQRSRSPAASTGQERRRRCRRSAPPAERYRAAVTSRAATMSITASVRHTTSPQCRFRNPTAQNGRPASDFAPHGDPWPDSAYPLASDSRLVGKGTRNRGDSRRTGVSGGVLLCLASVRKPPQGHSSPCRSNCKSFGGHSSHRGASSRISGCDDSANQSRPPSTDGSPQWKSAIRHKVVLGGQPNGRQRAAGAARPTNGLHRC